MKNILSRLLLAASLALGSLFVTALPAAAGTLDGATNCGDIGEQNFAHGSGKGLGTSYTGINAQINPDGGFLDCLGGFDALGGSSLWVAIQGPGVPDAILQIGIIRCHSTGPQCPRSGQYRYFWARAGCNGAVPYPLDIDPAPYGVGPADLNNHRYSIKYDVPNDKYKLYIDGKVVRSLGRTNSTINCWINNTNRVGSFIGERWDRGDGLAVGITHWTDTSLLYGSTWVPTNPQCEVLIQSPSNQSGCTWGTQYMGLWTVN
jgi:hypothetical protein